MVTRPLNVNSEVSFNYVFVCINTLSMLINGSELSISTNEHIAQYVEVTDI